MGACNSVQYATPVYKRIYIYGAGEERVDGIYRLCTKRAWRNGFPAYKNSSGYYLSYESVGTSESARGWVIGKMPTAFYGVKSELSCPPQAGWETFAGLEPSPQIVFTKFDADKLRANIFRDRVIKNKKAKSSHGNIFDHQKAETRDVDFNNENEVPKLDISNFQNTVQEQALRTSRSQFTTSRDFDNVAANGGQQSVRPLEVQSQNLIHSPFKPLHNSKQVYNPAFYNSPIKNPIHRGNLADLSSQSNSLDERIIETKYALEEKQKIEARIKDAKDEAERFKREQQAYMASLNKASINFR